MEKNNKELPATQYPYLKSTRLPTPCSVVLQELYRTLDDLPLIGLEGFRGDTDTIALLGYRRASSVLLSPISIPHGSAVIPVRYIQGCIVDLHDAKLHWFTQPRIHFANLRRRFWTRQIEVYPNTIQADVVALRDNIAAVELNGFSLDGLTSVVGDFNVKLIERRLLIETEIIGGRSMSKPPCFLLNVRDWLCSPSIARMTDKQVRAYLNLLCYSWLETPRATLPNDDRELAQLARLSEEEWEQVKGPILAKFVSDGNGRILNERLMKESDYCDKKSKAGAARWSTEGKQNGSKCVSKRGAK